MAEETKVVVPAVEVAEDLYSEQPPYKIRFEVRGTTDMLMHRYDVDEVERIGALKKGDVAKKTDNIENFAYRMNGTGSNLAIPGCMFHAAIAQAGKYEKSPLNTKSSLKSLCQAGLTILEENCDLGKKEWDLVDKRRVVVGYAAIGRRRPRIKAGWKAKFTVLVTLPEYFAKETVLKLVGMAGDTCGVGDFRPSYGRFTVVDYKVV